ncbi:MAG: aminoglycoside phosphotransferase family protein [Candidatus Binatia bacterium]
MGPRKRLDRVARRLKRFERCRDTIEQEVYRLIAGERGNGPKEIRIVQAESGVSTLTFFVDCDGKRSYVLRCLLRRREVRYLPEIYAFCQNNRISAPKLFGKCNGLWWRIKIGFHLLLEEFIEAEPIENILGKPDRRILVVDGLAKCLANLHDVARSDYGRISKPDSRPYLDHYVKKARQKLERIQKTVPEISTAEIRPIDQFLLAESNQFHGARSYSLLHGDPSNGNVLVDQSNHVTLIDLEYMHFGIHQYDLQMARHYLLKDDHEVFERFKQTYNLCRKNKAEESGRLDVLCRIFVLLRSLPLKSDEQRTETWWQQWREIQSLAGK